jgi:hypothetical protein
MKKPLCALIAALLLLTACASPAPAETAPTPSASPSPNSQLSTLNSPFSYPDVDALPTLAPFALDEKYTRRYPGTVTELLPRDDYRDLYPYLGGVGGGGMGVTPYVFGFCTAGGEIVCDPAYGDPVYYEYGGSAVYVFRKAFGARGTPDNDWRSVTDFSKMYIMPTDGSALYEYDGVSTGENGIFSVCADGKWGVVDYGGNELIPCRYASPCAFPRDLPP